MVVVKKKNLILDVGDEPLTFSPFDSLPREGTAAPKSPNAAPQPESKPATADVRTRGRVDIIRQRAHRGGKTVTVITSFKGIALDEKQALAKQIQKACGVGGTVKNGNIEIQGDQRKRVAEVLKEAGFRPVFAGG